MTRPRAADDFAVIRARIEELRRECAAGPPSPEARPFPQRPYHTTGSTPPDPGARRLPPAMREKLFR